MWRKCFYGVIMVLAVSLMYLAGASEARTSERTAATIYSDKEVAITFDDGPHKEFTKKLLDGLRERGVRATFFVVGENIPGNEDIIKQMHDDGHLIGNHTYTHVQLTKLSREAAIDEIEKTNKLIEEITGDKVHFIRPPCGAWNDNILFETELTPILWDVDPLDWCTYKSGLVVNKVLKKTTDGDIILLHDIFDTSVTAALEIVDRLKQQGYKFLTVDEIIIE